MTVDTIRAGQEKNFPGVDLEDENLANCQLEKINLAGANLVGADFSRSNLKGARLDGANLLGANLKLADLRANLLGANLMQADLSSADLRGSNLRGANLMAANSSITWRSLYLKYKLFLGWHHLYYCLLIQHRVGLLLINLLQRDLLPVDRFLQGLSH